MNDVGITYHGPGPVEVGDILRSPRTYYVVVASRKVKTRDGRPKWALRCERRFTMTGACVTAWRVARDRDPRVFPLRWFPRKRRTPRR